MISIAIISMLATLGAFTLIAGAMYYLLIYGWVAYRFKSRWKPYRISVKELAELPDEVFSILAKKSWLSDAPDLVRDKILAAQKERSVQEALDKDLRDPPSLMDQVDQEIRERIQEREQRTG